ncbi:hypothetical protein CPG38_00775 [Malaciobacter marinus]|nr:hypothetical protein CPG38_00775 [Malaciobacter marinus]
MIHFQNKLKGVILKNKIVFSLFFIVTVFFTACSNIAIQNESIKANVSFTNTYFKALILNDKKVVVFNKEPHIKFQENGKVVGSLGCNNFFGSYKKEKNTISFQAIASTKMMCPNIKTEDAFSKVLQNVKTYEIKGEFMSFFDKNKKEIAKFKAVYF